MPIYEYRCQSCGKELETTQRIVDPPLKECPSCHQPSLERLISATSFQLKGSGWYKDGYGGGKKARSESTVVDRLDKAITDDKKKDAASPAAESLSTSKAESSPSAAASSSGGGGTSGGGTGST